MVCRKLGNWAFALGAGAVLLGWSGECRACCFLDRMFGARTAYYAPSPYAVAAPVATGCGTCGPQVSYRTAYYPAAWTYQANLVPYATYRVVYSDPYSFGCAPCAATCAPCVSSCAPFGSPCGVGGCSTTYVGSGCSPCGTSIAPTPVYPAPVAPVLPSTSDATAPATVPAPAAASPSPSNTAPSVVNPLAPIPDNNTSPTKTFQGGQEMRRPVTPPAEAGPRLNSTPVPKRTPSDRTASRTFEPTPYYQLLASPPKVVPVRPVAADDDDAWRPSRD